MFVFIINKAKVDWDNWAPFLSYSFFEDGFLFWDLSKIVSKIKGIPCLVFQPVPNNLDDFKIPNFASWPFCEEAQMRIKM